ncbi:hypothetical protein GCM10009826_13040 [Humibacillus xanthopallidus]
MWPAALAGSVAMDRPAILRFDTDDFVDRLKAELDDPAREVGALVLRPETWRSPASGLGYVGTEVPKLYQPIHARFYLVVASLVCARYGLPDKAIHPTSQETTYAVLRRLEPRGAPAVDPTRSGTFREFGWVPRGERGSWVELSAVPGGATAVVAGEEPLAAFPLTYVEGPDGRRRRVLAAMVPVARREVYEAAVTPVPISSTDPAAALALPGRSELEAIVLELKSVIRLAGAPTMTEATSVDQLREALFFALIDLASFLSRELSQVWNQAGTDRGGDTLPEKLAKPAFGSSWWQALHTADAHRNDVVSVGAYPPPVAGRSVDEMKADLAALGLEADGPTVQDPFFALVSDAMGAPDPAPDPASGAGPASAADPQVGPSRNAVYAVRFVYQRPRCPDPQRLTMSALSPTFRLAHFHDPDAPFRENRIVLPVDTSLAGLRKFPQAVKVEVSAQLRKQMERIQDVKLGDLDDGSVPGEKDVSLGMVCSLSIPIIAICALVLLMIVVSLLNLVFFWVPLFKKCLPKAPG